VEHLAHPVAFLRVTSTFSGSLGFEEGFFSGEDSGFEGVSLARGFTVVECWRDRIVLP